MIRDSEVVNEYPKTIRLNIPQKEAAYPHTPWEITI